MVFTASEKEYADAILDIIDPGHKLIQARFYRDSCIQQHGLYVKDLRIFQKPLSDIAIVDNRILSFGFQLENGIPIIDFTWNQDDQELIDLSNYLQVLAEQDDVRECNSEAFRLKSIQAGH